MSRAVSAHDRRVLAIAAAVAVVLLPNIPWVSLLEYPLRLIVTSAHEMGHALAAILTGGHVKQIEIYPDGSGVTWSAGGIRLVVASAGYVGSTIFGCVLLVLAQRSRWHGVAITGLALYFAAFTFLFARNPLALGLGLAVLALLYGLARSRMSGAPLYFLLDFIALSSCLYSLNDFVGLIRISMGLAHVSGQTDAATLEMLTGVPAVAWALGWGFVSVAAAGFAARAAWGYAEE